MRDISKPVWRHKAVTLFRPIRCKRKGFHTKAGRQRGTNRRSVKHTPAATIPTPNSTTAVFRWQPLATANHKSLSQWSTCSQPKVSGASSNKCRCRTIRSSWSEVADRDWGKFFSRDFPHKERFFKAKNVFLGFCATCSVTEQCTVLDKCIVLKRYSTYFLTVSYLQLSYFTVLKFISKFLNFFNSLKVLLFSDILIYLNDYNSFCCSESLTF